MSSVIKLSAPATRDYWEIPVLFEDEHVLVIDKPACLLTSPDRYDPNRPNLMRLLHEGITKGSPWAKERNLDYLSNAHRLDFETSGVLMLAKNKPALVTLANLFGSPKPHKTYVALTQGNAAEKEFQVDAKISPHPFKLGLMRVDMKGGKQSRTRFEVMESFRGYTLLRCFPVTGRTHQIRIHLKHAKLPIVADDAYGGRPLMLSRLKKDYRLKDNATERPLIGRVALHAEKLELAHPVTGELLRVEASWPKDLAVAVKYLKRFAGGGAIAAPETAE